jgi:hypothetical protein
MKTPLNRSIKVREETWLWLTVTKARQGFRDVDELIMNMIKGKGGRNDKEPAKAS